MFILSIQGVGITGGMVVRYEMGLFHTSVFKVDAKSKHLGYL